MHTPYLDLYRRVLRLRLVEQAIASEYPQQKMRCPVHLSIGQEAVAVGAGMALKPEDVLLASHRSHGPYIAMNGDVYGMLAELYGKADGCCAGKGGSMHLAHIKGGFWGAIPIVASAIPLATGVAQAFKMQNQPRVSMVLFGDGATEEGVFHESMQWAHFKNLPVVFVCENNRLAVNTPYEQRRPADIQLKTFAEAHGLAVASADGNDVFAVFQACAEAVERARAGNGPTYLEFETYRLIEHCGPADDHDLPYRSKAELQAWKQRCPVKIAEGFLVANGYATPDMLQQMQQEEQQGIATAMVRAQEAPFPDEMQACGPVYSGDSKCVK